MTGLHFGAIILVMGIMFTIGGFLYGLMLYEEGRKTGYSSIRFPMWIIIGWTWCFFVLIAFGLTVAVSV